MQKIACNIAEEGLCEKVQGIVCCDLLQTVGMFADEIRISVDSYRSILGTDPKIHCLFHFSIYSLLNNSVSSSGYMLSNDRMNNELERMWKEAVMV
jgi:hypothetical protein